MRIVLVRHGRTTLNAADRLRGRLDPALDDIGREEVAALAAALQPLRPSRIVSSPLRRAVETAEAISARTDVPITVDRRLIDRDYGPWAGQPPADIVAEWGSLDAAPGVEPAHAVISRARGVLDEHADGDGVVVLVSHDAVNRLLLAVLDPGLGEADDIAQRTACWNVLDRTDARWLVTTVDAHG
jgi:broad specificity phosphatase PhoE